MVAGSRHLLTGFEGTSILRPKMHQHPHLSINFLFRYGGEVVFRQKKLKRDLFGNVFSFRKILGKRKGKYLVYVYNRHFFLSLGHFLQKLLLLFARFGHLQTALVSNIVTTTASSSTDSVSLSLSSSMTSSIICPRESLKLHEPPICQILRTQLQTPACSFFSEYLPWLCQGQ
jgi:hypothetical protein